MTNRLGEAQFLSGYNHYIRSNLTRKQVLRPTIDDGPTIFNLPEQDPDFAIISESGTQDFDITFDDTMDWVNENNAAMYIFQGQPQNAQVNFFDGPWRISTQISGNLALPSTSPVVDKPTTYALAAGQNVFYYARISRADGRLSEPFRSSGFVV